MTHFAAAVGLAGRESVEQVVPESLFATLICRAVGCVIEKDLREVKRSDWIENDQGILAPKEIAPEKDK